MRRFVIAALALVALAAVSTESTAGILSTRVVFVKDSEASLALEKEGIRVVSYRFARQVRGSAKPFKWGEGPAIVFNVRNDGPTSKDFGLAVALFDKAGNLLGAASESPKGKLDPGETKEVRVVFQGVNQNTAQASSLYLSLETKL